MYHHMSMQDGSTFQNQFEQNPSSPVNKKKPCITFDKEPFSTPKSKFKSVERHAEELINTPGPSSKKKKIQTMKFEGESIAINFEDEVDEGMRMFGGQKRLHTIVENQENDKENQKNYFNQSKRLASPAKPKNEFTIGGSIMKRVDFTNFGDEVWSREINFESQQQQQQQRNFEQQGNQEINGLSFQSEQKNNFLNSSKIQDNNNMNMHNMQSIEQQNNIVSTANYNFNVHSIAQPSQSSSSSTNFQNEIQQQSCQMQQTQQNLLLLQQSQQQIQKLSQIEQNNNINIHEQSQVNTFSQFFRMFNERNESVANLFTQQAQFEIIGAALSTSVSENIIQLGQTFQQLLIDNSTLSIESQQDIYIVNVRGKAIGNKYQPMEFLASAKIVKDSLLLAHVRIQFF